jgi:hypothetical protein
MDLLNFYIISRDPSFIRSSDHRVHVRQQRVSRNTHALHPMHVEHAEFERVMRTAPRLAGDARHSEDAALMPSQLPHSVRASYL